MVHPPLTTEDNPKFTPHLIEIAVPLPVFNTYTYKVPQEWRKSVSAGKRVLVPFGRRRITGYVLGPATDTPNVHLKAVLDVMDAQPLFPSQMITFFKWIADYYMHPLGEVIQAALPTGINVAEYAQYSLTPLGEQVRETREGKKAENVMSILQGLQAGPCRLTHLRRDVDVKFSHATLATLMQKGWVQRDYIISSARTRPKTLRFVSLQPFNMEATKLSPSRRKIVDILLCHGEMALPDLKKHVPTAANLIRAMEQDSQVRIFEKAVFRDPLGAPIDPDQPPELTTEQAQAVAIIETELGRGFRAFLLAGVTGSGKTEVYLRLAVKALEQKLAVLVLVPEIGLISQTERAFRARFGQKVALLHSGLSNGERLDQWERIAKDEVHIAIGARSAIFAPFKRIGLIIVDEEHDDAYKQEVGLRYHARDLAVVRARQNQALAILGSATPSLQSAHNVHIGKYQQVALSRRIDQRLLPEIVVQDLSLLREERGLRRFLTPDLIEAMQTTLVRNEQILLFLNRRGFASVLVCATCGQPLRCDHCDISLTYHKRINAYACHYCGFSRPAVTRCSNCGSANIKRLGLGTEKLEVAIQEMFPKARVARMDRDTTQRKGAVVKILKALRHRQIDILIGTQMVAKGHNFPHITLVGIVCADLSLSLPDFRAGERTFQLLTQVAGRAGRGTAPGRVILQTYNPHHFGITAAQNQNYQAFFQQEIEFRKALGYPPFSRMIQIRISSRDKKQVAAYARGLGNRCQSLRQEHKPYAAVEVLGPLEAPLQRIAGRYRWQLLLKGPQTRLLRKFVQALLFNATVRVKKQGIRIGVDVDPVFLM